MSNTRFIMLSSSWDSQKAAANLRKHKVTFELACEAFFDPFVCYLDEEISGSELRERIVGLTMNRFRFFHPIEVRYGDLDPQGHVNNAKHLTFFEQARIAYMIELGLFTKDQSFMEIGVILADIHITYLAPIYFGEHIKVGVHASKLGNKSMTWMQNIVDAKTGKELAKGEVVLVTYDYREAKTINIPHEWREKIKAFEGL